MEGADDDQREASRAHRQSHGGALHPTQHASGSEGFAEKSAEEQ